MINEDYYWGNYQQEAVIFTSKLNNHIILGLCLLDLFSKPYLLVEIGWQNGYRIYGTLLHIDIINNKLWIQHDGTEEGIADDFVALGIPKQQIVLGFKPIDRRQVTEFAIS
ncbi:MAG: XisI protein [Symploca sp. SIO1A3]|nr:XisI protein [Symploca sp. SIO1A3]